MPSTEGLAARRAALQLLDAVLRRGQTIDSAGAQIKGLQQSDHGLALAIAGEALRRLRDIDELIDSATRMRLPDDSKARSVLRLALAQRIGLNTPEHAVIATSLPLVDGGPRRLVHGVLGTLFRKGLPAFEVPRLPADVEDRWASAWTDDVVFAARRQITSRPPLDLTFADEQEAIAYAVAHGGLSLAPQHVRLKSSSVGELPGFSSGRWWVQDLAASLPARLIPRSASSVLDLCAAPGGKTMQLAAAGHVVTSVDSSASRLRRLSENLERTHLTSTLVEGDALKWTPSSLFDAVLLDAPCSATGTFRRHPEVLVRARPDVIEWNAERQLELVTRASQWVSPGGTLVYSVCSLERAEGEDIIEEALRRDPKLELVVPDGLPPFVSVNDRGWVRILPGILAAEGGVDGFFIARLVRAG